MIESRYWKEDLLKYAKLFKPKKTPSRLTEKAQVNLEKDVIIAFFMVRKLMESTKLSSKTTEYKATLYRSPCVGKVNNSNFWDIEKIYDFEQEEKCKKDVRFVCNQLIHGGATYAYRDETRNWGGLYTCSDFERSKYVYNIPLDEIVKILEIASNDYPTEIHYVWKNGDYKVTTN